MLHVDLGVLTITPRGPIPLLLGVLTLTPRGPIPLPLGVLTLTPYPMGSYPLIPRGRIQLPPTLGAIDPLSLTPRVPIPLPLGVLILLPITPTPYPLDIPLVFRSTCSIKVHM